MVVRNAKRTDSPIMTKRNSEQDKIRIIAVDTSTDLARRLTDLLGKDKADVYRESRLDRVLERFESEFYADGFVRRCGGHWHRYSTQKGVV